MGLKRLKLPALPAAASGFGATNAEPIRLLPSFSQNWSSVAGANGANTESKDASCTSAVTDTGAGTPGGEASSGPTPTIAAPLTPVATYWRADIRDVRFIALFFDTWIPPNRRAACRGQFAM